VSTLEQGSVIAGKYKIAGVIATTELSELFEARHIQLDDSVIVKVLSDGVYDARLAAKFVREARNAARVKSDHVARFMDVGTLPDGRPFVVMEYLDGEDAESMLKRGERIPISVAVDWIVQACDALATAHRIGIVHRDLRPSSLYLARSGAGRRTVKVMNFGTSRVADSLGTTEDAGLTVAGLVSGSPDYAAPEVILRSAADARADVWSIGAVLYELLTGVRPFDGEPDNVIKRIVADPPRAPRTFHADIPPALEAIVQKCLEKSPANRFANVDELASALGPFASETGLALARQMNEPRRPTLSPRGLAVLDDEEDGPDVHEKANLHRRTADGGIVSLAPSKGGHSLAAPAQAASSAPRPAVIVLALVVLLAVGGFVALRMRSGAEVTRNAAAATDTSARVAPPATTAEPSAPVESTNPVPVASPMPTAASTNEPNTNSTVAAPGARTRHTPAVRTSTPSTGVAPAAATTNDDPWGWKR
jgi:serine/threonine-protein kinase